MSSASDKIKGTANEAMGKVKQGIGKMTDDKNLQAEGKFQEIKGDAQKTVGKAKDAIKDATRRSAVDPDDLSDMT